MSRLTLKRASKILKQHGYKKSKQIMKAIDEKTGDIIKNSMAHKRFLWWIHYDKFLSLPTSIIYHVGIPGFILDTWEPDIIDKYKCRGLNPIKKPFNTEEELMEILNKYEAEKRH